ncbi:hypothetical protein [Bacteriophage Eos]|nr:hypothetical protein [Bacteriophage Eos]
MIFYPSESFILGLFIITAIFFIISAALNIAKIFADNKYWFQLSQLIMSNIWFARIFLLLALAAGIASSLLPVDSCNL